MKRNASDPPRLKRGRPSKQQAEEIDRRVLDAARDCFLAGGFEGTSMEVIAERAGVTKVTLYQRHSDKVALLRAVIQDRLEAWSQIAARTNWMLGDTLDQRLRHYARAVLTWQQDKEVRSFTKLVDATKASAEAIGQELEQLLRAPMLKLLQGEIEAFAARDGIPLSDGREAALMFLGLLQGFAPRNSGPGRLPQEVGPYADHAVNIFIHGRQAW